MALVTGAARGLGQALALAIAEAGADVAALDILPVDSTCESISRLGRRGHAISMGLLISDFSFAVGQLIVHARLLTTSSLPLEAERMPASRIAWASRLNPASIVSCIGSPVSR